MQSQVFASLVKPVETVRWILWAALTAVIVIYAAILFVVFGNPASLGEGLSSPLAIPLALVAIVSAVLSRFLPGLLLTDEALRQRLASDPDPKKLPTDARTEQLSGREQRILGALDAFLGPFIARLALGEAVALYGLVLGFLSRSAAPMLPFAAAALVLNLTTSPKLDADVERAARLCPIG